MKKKDQQQTISVQKFFDNISKEYRNKYKSLHPFLHYFFRQRLSEATSNFSFKQKSLLDIGAGTGELFHFLKEQNQNFEYFAIDISSRMLEESTLSPSQYFVGEITDFHPSEKEYDFIFLLGVTTYFDSEELENHFNFIKTYLAADGFAILSFTNRNSFDFKLRQVVRFFTRLIGLKQKVMGQNFEIFAYSPQEVSNLIQDNFLIYKQVFLNQTFPPFNRLFPKTSIAFGNFLNKNISSPTLLSWLSSDFLIFIQKEN